MPGSPAIINALLRQFADDSDSGTVRTLEDYQSLFPGYEDTIAKVLESLSKRGEFPSSQTGDVGGVTSDEGPVEAPEKVLGHYRLLREIGRGGQGIVWLAEDSRLRRRVALKTLRGAMFADPATRQRFEREARVASSLDEPGICTVYEVGETDGQAWIAMRFLDGEPLAARLRRIPRPPDRAEIEARARIVEGVARSLHAAHEAGIIHRDLKPGNVILTKGDTPVIVDFGLARGGTETLTAPSDVLGTPAYMAPERLDPEGSADAGIPSDVWSLGVMLYEAVCGRRPFEGPTPEAVIGAIANREPASPKVSHPAVSKDLGTVILTSLAKDPRHRYASSAALAEDLRRVLEHEPILARPAGPWTRLLRWAQRNRALAASLAAAVLLLVVGAGMSTFFAVQSNTNLTQWTRLSDGRLLEDLVAEAERDLWPAVPSKIERMERWLVRARDLAGRLPDHESALADLRERAAPYGAADAVADRAFLLDENSRLEEIAVEILAREGAATRAAKNLPSVEARLGELNATAADLSPSEERELERLEKEHGQMVDMLGWPSTRRPRLESERAELEAKVSARRTWRFEDDGDRFRHERLQELVEGLKSLMGSAGAATILSVESRLELARKLMWRLESEDRAAWAATVADVGRPAPPYHGLRLEPIAGLVPLGKEENSGLWSFWHVATGERPRWDGEPLGVGNVVLDTHSAREGFVLMLIPAGSFAMGVRRPDAEHPEGSRNVDPSAGAIDSFVHEVTLSAFFFSKYEMTQGQWERLWGANPSYVKAGEPSETGAKASARHPVTNTDWNQARQTLRRLDLELPTEAQWEYACRARTTTVYHTGDDYRSLLGYANIGDASRATKYRDPTSPDLTDGFIESSPVGSLKPNAFGLHDMHGNVAEWCLDALRMYSGWKTRPGDGLRGPIGGRDRIIRGGAFTVPAFNARSGHRDRNNPSLRSYYVGCRPARNLAP